MHAINIRLVGLLEIDMLDSAQVVDEYDALLRRRSFQATAMTILDAIERDQSRPSSAGMPAWAHGMFFFALAPVDPK